MNNIKTLSFGCRLNSLEAEKIAAMLSPVLPAAIVVNTCSVTAEAERQSAQAVRRLARDNVSAPIFVTGCGATRNPGLFTEIPNAIVIDNSDKMKLGAYLTALATSPCHQISPHIQKFRHKNARLSKQFIQIQNGCHHACSYCVTRLLRGKNESFPYTEILSAVRSATCNGFYEIVLTGVDIASYVGENQMLLGELCNRLLADVPDLQRLRLSSVDPASPEIPKILNMMRTQSRMMPHMHLSMQSGSDQILGAMRRRHNANMVREFALANPYVSFSWDIICGFPGETDKLFAETVALARELHPIKIHAFPYSSRPGTEAADMPNHTDRAESKRRVKIIIDLADESKREFMQSQLGSVVSVLMEENNIARTPDDIEVHILGPAIPAKTICNVTLCDISDLHFIGNVC